MVEVLTGDKLEYYTPTPQQGFGGTRLELPNYLKDSKYFNTLVHKCLTPFQRRTPERIQVFTNGDDPYPPTDSSHRALFMKETAEVVARYSQDLLTADGNLMPGREQEWFNLIEIAPRLIEIMTNRDNYITLVQKSQTLDIVATALHMARFPNTEVVFRIGIGGSDDEFTSARSAAYGVPALKILEQINKLYDERKQSKLLAAAIRKGFADYERLHGIPSPKEERTKISNRISANGNYADDLTVEKQAAVLAENAIPSNLPRIEFFCAYQAAIAINHTMDPDRVRQRAVEGIDVLRQYVISRHPQIAGQVGFLEDIPWAEHKPHSKIILEYMAHLLRSSTEDTIQDTLTTLQNLGNKHGGQNGAEQAAEYAAIHPWAFGDRLNLPYTRYLEGSKTNPTINITIGGKPERHFCAIRDYLSKYANPDGLLEFIRSKLEQSSDSQERDFLARLAGRVERWKRRIDWVRQKQYAPDLNQNPSDHTVIRPDRPLLSVSLVTSIGLSPTYYATEFDRPHNTDPFEYDAFLRQQAEWFVNHPPTNEGEALRRLTLQAIVFDMQALRGDQEPTSFAPVQAE